MIKSVVALSRRAGLQLGFSPAAGVYTFCSDGEAWVKGLADFARRKQLLTPGFAVPSPLGEGRYQTAAPM
jgi:hypothetical protein